MVNMYELEQGTWQYATSLVMGLLFLGLFYIGSMATQAVARGEF